MSKEMVGASLFRLDLAIRNIIADFRTIAPPFDTLVVNVTGTRINLTSSGIIIERGGSWIIQFMTAQGCDTVIITYSDGRKATISLG